MYLTVFLHNQPKKFLHWKAWTSDFPGVRVGGSWLARPESGLLVAQTAVINWEERVNT